MWGKRGEEKKGEKKREKEKKRRGKEKKEEIERVYTRFDTFFEHSIYLLVESLALKYSNYIQNMSRQLYMELRLLLTKPFQQPQ